MRALGKTGLRVSDLALGTWGLSGDAYGAVERAERQRVVRRALEMGLSLIDTADAYGAGQMERLIGDELRETARDAIVVTKGGIDRTTSPPRRRFDGAYLRDSVHRSLRRMRRDRIDVYLLHNPGVSTLTAEPSEAIDALLELKREDKIAHWGVSVGDVAVGRAALRKGAEVVELPYNLLHPSDLHRLAGEVVVAGAGVLARSTLAYGMLAGSWSKDHEFAPGDHRADRWTRVEFERRIEQLSSLRFLLNGEVRTPAAAAIRFVLSNSIVSCAVLGPRSVSQLEEIVRDVGMGPIYLRDADLGRIPRALEAAGIDP